MSRPDLLTLLILAALVAVGVAVVAVEEIPPDEDPTLAEEDTESGWSEWSEWSPCSRTCDGGAAVQSRRCLDYAGCRGDSVRYQLCNLEPCPEGSRDFRSVQCSEYDGLPHEGELYEWEPAEGEALCALTCRARGGGPVVTLNPRVRDGTRCTKETLDLCINGRCQKVGCDLRLGSHKAVDACGVCGGDGTTCGTHTYHWEKRPTGPCSATCGGGYQMLSGVCVEQITGRRVGEDLCDLAARPIPVILNCNDDACPTSWQTGDWGTCSVSCGSGYQLREVFCAEPRNTTAVRVADHYCSPPRPQHRQPCNTHDCPRWYDGIWSQCSATCGDGVQKRVVLCRDAHGRSSRHCNPAQRPTSTRPCRTGVPCPAPATLAHPRHQPYTPAWWPEEQDLASEEGVAPLMPRPQALTADQQVPAEPTYMTGNWSACSVKCGEGVRTRSVTCKIFLEFSRTVAVLPDDQCPGIKPAQTQRCVLPPCSHAMTRHDYPVGEVSDAAQDPPIASLEDAHDGHPLDSDDHRTHETPFLPRLVDEDTLPKGSKTDPSGSDLSAPQAQAYNEPRPGLHSLENGDGRPPSDPLLLYTGISHDQFESYEAPHEKKHHVAEHSEMNSIEIDMGGGDGSFRGTYQVSDVAKSGHQFQWFSSGFSPCSASCLGGVQESVVHCIRVHDKKIVTPQLCNMEGRPDVITRTCNDQPCPPRWNVGEFGACSKQCGRGVQSREVKCIHEVTRGGINTIQVPNSLCPQPPQHNQQYCNIIDCQPDWVPTRWSKCSAPCGGGIKSREVRCKQTNAVGTVIDRPNRDCPHRTPPTARKCNRRACQGGLNDGERPLIYAQNNQDYVQSKFMKKLTLKVGGKATVFRGVRVKVKCPVRRFERSKITWWHDGQQITHTGKTRTTKKGVLKFRGAQYTDQGTYICRAGKSVANLTLVVTPLPSSYLPTKEREQGNAANEVSLHTHEDTTFNRNDLEWTSNKPAKNGRGNRHRQGSRGSRRRKNKAKPAPTSHTTLRPIQPFPMGPESGALGEGPFKASSKNMHTVEVSSSEATNVYEGNHGHVDGDTRSAEDTYVYGTITHHTTFDEDYGRGSGWDREENPIFGVPNHISERTEEGHGDKKHYYGKITHHSDGSRMTSEERHIFGTLRSEPTDSTLTEHDKMPYPGLASTENYLGGKKTDLDREVENGIEDDLTRLGEKLNLSPEESDMHQRTISSRGGRHISDTSDDLGELVSHDLVRDATTTDHPFGIPEILGKGTRDSLEFEWQMTNWSACSQTCGFTSTSSGFQVRSIQCLVRVNNVSRPVDGALCDDAGMEPPITIQKCGLTECPQWHFDDWSECETSRCFTLHYAFQRRDVVCRLHNGTVVSNDQCDDRTKPRHRRECYNKQCVGKWRVGEWSKCQAPCGGQGYRTRLLQCVWNGTKKAAGNACRELPRPEVVRWCDADPCPEPSM